VFVYIHVPSLHGITLDFFFDFIENWIGDFSLRSHELDEEIIFKKNASGATIWFFSLSLDLHIYLRTICTFHAFASFFYVPFFSMWDHFLFLMFGCYIFITIVVFAPKMSICSSMTTNK